MRDALTYQGHRLDEECREAKEALHNEASQNALDLGYPRACRVLR